MTDSVTSRHVDPDHPVPYRPWQLRQPAPGVWDRRSPHGHWWRVDHTGTHYHGTDPPPDGPA